MEFLDGHSLKELIVARGPAPVSMAIAYTRKILDALRFAHRNGIVHRDIKPHNVIVDAEGRLKVTDFGIARAGTSQMTEAGSIIGTAQYLSPEQARARRSTRRSDLYSVAIVLYELLTGKVPFTGDSPVEIAMKHISAVPKPPSSIAARRAARTSTSSSCARSRRTPDERYPSAEEMDADLARVAQRSRRQPRDRGGGDADPRAVRTPQPMTAVAAPPRPPCRGPATSTTDRAAAGRCGRGCSSLLLLVAAGLTGWFVYQQVQDELADAGTVGVPYLIDLGERQAVAQVLDAGLEPNVIREPNADVEAGFVFDQAPKFGENVDPGNAGRHPRLDRASRRPRCPT